MSRRGAFALLLAGACVTPRPFIPAAARIGQRLELAAVDHQTGRMVDVGADQGRVRVVELWATWCVPCREAMPVLDAMAAELGPRGLAVYGVSFDEDPALLPVFLREVPVRFPILWERGGDQLAARLDVVRLPTTLVVDRRGILRHVHEGFTPGQATEERREVEALLGEPAPGPSRPGPP